MADIGSSNLILMLSVPLLIPIPQRIQGFATDDAFEFPEIQPTETMMGVDGFLSGGVIFVEQSQKITLMPDSLSNSFFDAWFAGQKSAGATLVAQGIVTYPATGLSYTLLNGFLKAYKMVADAKKIQQPRSYSISWQQVNVVPVGTSG